jgi:hypothetical protein
MTVTELGQDGLIWLAVAGILLLLVILIGIALSRDI